MAPTMPRLRRQDLRRHLLAPTVRSIPCSGTDTTMNTPEFRRTRPDASTPCRFPWVLAARSGTWIRCTRPDAGRKAGPSGSPPGRAMRLPRRRRIMRGPRRAPFHVQAGSAARAPRRQKPSMSLRRDQAPCAAAPPALLPYSACAPCPLRPAPGGADAAGAACAPRPARHTAAAAPCAADAGSGLKILITHQRDTFISARGSPARRVFICLSQG